VEEKTNKKLEHLLKLFFVPILSLNKSKSKSLFAICSFVKQ
jgi:hypothetical protein